MVARSKLLDAGDRISVDPERMGDVPCVRDLRFPVASVVAMVADGMTVSEITEEHPDPGWHSERGSPA